MTVRFRTQSNQKITTADEPNKEFHWSDQRMAILGHEIRNPLGALNAALQAWPSTTDDPQLSEELLQIMRRQVHQLTRLCNDLLDSGGIANGQLSICRSSVNLGEVIRSACEEIRPFTDQCGHTLTVAINGSTLMMDVDESRLIQVFANLLHNASKFTARNGHLQIFLEQDHDNAIIRVRDNGRGMNAVDLQSVFSAEHASMRNSDRSGAGLGIGLRLAKSIIELHGGTIEVFSRGPGHGSTFVVKLPIAIDSPSSKTESGRLSFGLKQCCDKTLPQYRVVVVDDDRSMRFLMSHMLQNLKQTVTVADSGEMALRVIPTERPQVVFLDLQMHDVSGFDVAREIRRQAEFKDVILIAVSGNSDQASRTLAAQSGFDHYLVKPTSMAELTNTLARIGSLSVCES